MTIDPTNARAVIEWRAPHGEEPTAAIQRAFREARYDLVLGASPTRFGRQPDLSVIDLRSSAPSARDLEALVCEARASGAPCGIVIYLHPDQREAVEARRPRRLILDSAHPPAALVAAIDARLRLGRLGETAAIRTQALVALDCHVNWPTMAPRNRTLRLLVGGQPAAHALALINALRREGAEASTAFSAAQIMAAFDHEDFDGLILRPRTQDDLLVMLGRSLKRQARYRTLPVFLIDDDLECETPPRRGDLLTQLSVGNDPAAATREICRAADLRRRSEALRGVLTALDDHERRLRSSIRKEFFLTQTDLMIRGRTATKAPVGAIVVETPSSGSQVDVSRQKTRLADHVLRSTFRLQDTAFQINAATWIMLCPHAPSDAHPAIAERAGRICQSVLGSGPLRTAAISLEAHEKAPEFIARALRALRDKGVSASA